MTPDREASLCPVSCVSPQTFAAPMGSPICSGTPVRGTPAKGTPAKGTPARGVATPLRSTRRCSFATAPLEEHNVPTPRTLNLCDFACDATFGTKSVTLEDLASPGPLTCGQSPADCDMSLSMHHAAEGSLEIPLLQEISSIKHSDESVLEVSMNMPLEGMHDPRKRRNVVSLPAVDPRLRSQPLPLFVAVPAKHGYQAAQSSSDPRRRRRRLLPESSCIESLPQLTPCKRRLSPAASTEECLLTLPATPKCARAPGSCRSRRYRSPTPCPEHAEERSISVRCRDRSLTPGPSRT